MNSKERRKAARKNTNKKEEFLKRKNEEIERRKNRKPTLTGNMVKTKKHGLVDVALLNNFNGH
jgi:hypothetical protein